MMNKTTFVLLGALCAISSASLLVTMPAAAQLPAPPAARPAAQPAPPITPPARSPAPATAPVLTLADAVARARAQHPGVEAAAGQVMATRGATRQLGAFPNPVVEWRVESINTPLDPDRFLTATFPLDLSGRRLALRSSGRAAVRSAEAGSEARLREIEFQAASAYWEAALAQSLLDAAATHREALAGIAEYDAIRLREGAISEAAALRTRLEADRARIAEATARTEHARARAELARALGTSADSIPRLEPLVAEAAKAAWRPPYLADALARARAERPELHAATATVDAARLRRTAERRATLPEVGLTGGMKTTNGVSGAVIGITMPLPLFDRHGGARELAAGELRIAEAHLRETEAAITAEVTTALEAVEALLAALAPEDRDLGGRGREIAEIMEAAYREGGATLVELLEARRAAADAQAAALQWHADLRIALLTLNRATGAPILENIP
jgi:cobalt-zinc-cadmium efflux system outer membrane protein